MLPIYKPSKSWISSDEAVINEEVQLQKNMLNVDMKFQSDAVYVWSAKEGPLKCNPSRQAPCYFCQKRSSPACMVMNKLPSHPPVFILTPSRRPTLICIYHPDPIPSSYTIDYMTYYCFRMPVFLSVSKWLRLSAGQWAARCAICQRTRSRYIRLGKQPPRWARL